MRLPVLVVLMLLSCPSARSQTRPAPDSPFSGADLAPMTLRYETRIPAGDAFRILHTTSILAPGMLEERSVWEFVSISLDGTQVASTDVDVWDRRDLRAVRRQVDFNETRIENIHTADSLITRSVVDGNVTEQRIGFGYPVVSDGLLNRVALGTLPLREGYRTLYNSFVRRENAVRTQEIVVTGTETVSVPAGRFDTWVVTTELVGGGSKATLYVSQDAPRVVVRMTADLPNGAQVTVDLLGVMTEKP